LTLQADLTGGAYQKTQWVYGVTGGAGGSDIYSNDIVSAVKYPDKSTGNPSTSEQETYTVNAPGETKKYTDSNGTVHTYTSDVVGRPTSDAVTTLGTGVDGSVRRLETAYDTAGNAYLYTSYDAASAGNVVNQVQQVYNGLGQLTTEYQAHSGAVNTATTPKVQYAYSEMAGGANHSRLISLTYPNGRVLNYNYASGLDSTISRLSSLSDNSATLESYAYLGAGTVVKRAHPEPGVDLTYIKQSGETNGDAGDQYTGLDRFGRVVDQRWIVSSSGTATDRFKYAFDRDSNRLFRTNELNHSFDELYHANGASNGYDQLNQLTDWRRGTLTDANSDGILDTVTTASRSQSWTFDAQANPPAQTTNGTADSRTNNKQNQVTAIGSSTLAYDANGNLTTDDHGYTLIFDAWNHLIQAKNGSTVLVTYSYDASGRRITENISALRDWYYDGDRIVEERASGSSSPDIQYVWSPVYTDALIERDRDTDANGTLDERLYVQQDANWNVTAVLNTSGAVQERYDYDAFGSPSFLSSSWASLGSSGV